MTLCLLKVHLQTFLSIPIIKKCQILSFDNRAANERHVLECKVKVKQSRYRPGVAQKVRGSYGTQIS